jgi:hypothetical protein
MLDRDTQTNLLHVFTGVIIGASLVFLLQGKPKTKVHETIKQRNDTIRVIDTILSEKIKKIKLAPDIVVTKLFDTIYRDTGHSDTVKTTIYAERRCLEVTDSLRSCQQKIAVDDVAFDHIDTLVKTDPAPLKQRLLDAGAGLLIGLGLRSLL